MNIKITDLRDFKDMMISALRYALPRHTYIVVKTIDFIKDNAQYIIDRRTKSVMLSDIKYHFNMRNWDKEISINNIDDPIIIAFKEWLENYEVKEED